jgi:hypothetical protein
MTSPNRIAWPGLMVNSRIWPLRLLSSRSTATRWAIGVVPGGSRVTVCGMSTVSASASEAFCRFCCSAPRGPQAARASKAASVRILAGRLAIAQSGTQG